MGLFTFKGGIHPDDKKDLTKDKEVQVINPGDEVIIPLNQHIGAMAEPKVSKGDYVLVGQLIGEASGFVSGNIHSSVSGTVKTIDSRLTSNGVKVNCVIIENDGLYKEREYKKPGKKLNKMSKEDILNAIKSAGVVGMGGAGFPTNVKLSPKDSDKIEYVIVNGAECEPYITADYRRIMEEPEKIISGLKIVLKLFKNAKGIIAIEDNKPEAIRIMTKMTENSEKISVVPLKTKYPQGAERQLIYVTTKRLINSTMLPADAGCVVDNIDTIVAIHNAVVEGKPLYERIVTVSGDAIKNPGNYLVRLGTNCRDLIDAAGGFLVDKPEKIIAGGPMMGKAMFSIDVPSTKGLSAILCFKKDDVAASETSNCIRCGKCVDVCPGRVMPAKLATLAAHGAIDEFIENDGMECCECGCCSYVCPAKRHLTQTIAGMRKTVMANKKK